MGSPIVDAGLLILLLLSVVASSLFLILLPARLWSLRSEPVKVKWQWLGYFKFSISICLSLTLIGNVFSQLLENEQAGIELVPVYLALAASLGISLLSVYEHKRSIRPSTLIVVYLLTTLFFNIVSLTYPKGHVWQFYRYRLGRLVALEFIVRLTLLVLESHNKKGFLLPKFVNLSPEETAGVLSTSLFWWLNDLLALGNKKILGIVDIPKLDQELDPEVLRTAILRSWDQRSKPESGTTLPKVLVRCLASPFLSVIIPRIFLIVFRCSQPVLIDVAIEYVSHDWEDAKRSSMGYWLLLATAVTYFGLALSSSIYHHRLNRLEIMTKESLVSLIYSKTLRSSSQSDTSRAITLMSSDVDGVAEGAEMFHETWAKLVELTIGIILLATRVHWLWPLPLALIFLSSRVSRFVAQNIRSRQRGWTLATQKRISALSSILGSMKSVKALGLSESMGDYITSLRDGEIAASKHVRWMNVGYNASANALGIFTPVITIVLFAVIENLNHSRLSQGTAFSTIATLAIVTHPANMIMTIVPKAVAAFGNFDRIQSFLLEPACEDARGLTSTETSDISSTGVETARSNAAVRIKETTVKFPGQVNPSLSDISLTLPAGKVTICSGPVGSGKSVLAKLILGEVPLSRGQLEVSSTRIGYCDQKAWLPTGTVREIVCAFTGSFDQDRYNSVVRQCCLDYDVERFPNGHDTRIGTRGINLSGGQKQRLALARLLYARNDIVVLDDPFNALDGNTENNVIENLFGPQGWFKNENVTVFLVTNSAQHFHIADHILLLVDGKIKQQGTWDEMKASSAQMTKFTFDHSSNTQVADLKDQIQTGAPNNLDAERDLHRKTGDFSLYGYYIKYAGVFNFLLMVSTTVIYSLFNTVPAYWLKLWTESEGNADGTDSSLFYIVGYILLAFIAWVATSATMWSTLIIVASQSGKLLHQKLLSTVFGAPLSFFSSTDLGVTLNRFSQDIGMIDKQLPSAISALSVQIFKLLAQIVVLFVVQKQLAVTLPICVLAVYFVQRIYLRTSRQLRVLELESQAVLYSWFLETADGVSTIRAFQWQSDAEAKNTASLEHALRPTYTLLCLQRWLNLVLDLMIGGIAFCVVAIAVKWKSSTSAGDIGAALNLILVTNSTVIRLVQSFTSVEVSLGAISRLKSVNETTPQESQPGENFIPPSSWPSKGDLTVANLSAGYDAGQMILKHINLNVDEGNKLVICGRTGSGKSTAMLALLRLIESTGSIEVNNIDLSRVPRSLIRRRCFITVPQDPLILSDATLRFNMDPSSLASDDIIREALNKVGVWDAISSTPHDEAIDPLDQKMGALPATSVGQLQLFAMARAIIQKHTISISTEYSDLVQQQTPKPILLLDEATSSLDSITESTIYDIVESEFTAAGYTVVIIAHRLSIISDRMRRGKDLVAWFQDGELVKVGDYEDVAKFASSSTSEEGDSNEGG